VIINHFSYLNNGPKVKDLLFEHGGEGRVKGSNLHTCTLSLWAYMA
jgi:hypothetical protein